jgi:hypothetical protein
VGLGPMSFGCCKTQDTEPKSCDRVKKLLLSQRSMERATKEGDSPVDERLKSLLVFLSTTGHEESRGNLG